MTAPKQAVYRRIFRNMSRPAVPNPMSNVVPGSGVVVAPIG